MSDLRRDSQPTRLRIERRQFLRGSALLLAGGVVQACTARQAPPDPPTAVPAARPAATAPAAAAPAPAASPAAAAPAVISPSAASPVAAASPAAAAAAGPVKRGGTLIIARTADAPSLDPHKEAAYGRSLSTQNIYSFLIQTDESLRVIPDLAERWEIAPDGKTYTFFLRQGVKFHNGRDLVADDVKYSLERILNPAEAAYGRGFISSIDTVETPNPATVKLNLKNVDAALLVSLSSSFCAIIPKEEVEKAGGVLARTAVGTGPFVFDEWVPGQALKLKRNPNYYNKDLPYLDAITFQVIPEESQIVAQLRTGNVHMTTLQDNKNYTVVKDAPNLDVIRSQRLGFDYVNINCKTPPFDKVEVRQAMSYALDRKEYVQVAYAGLGNMVAPIPPAMKDFALDPDTLEEFKPNLDKAKALLAKAGLPSGFKTEILTITGFASLILGAQVVADNLKRVGIEAEIKQMEYGAWIKDWTAYNFQLSMNATGGNSDPDPLLFPRLSSKGVNNNNWVDDEVDAILAEGKTILDPQKRIDHYKMAQRVLVQKVPQLWLGQAELIDVLKKSVKGYVAHPGGFMPGLPMTWLES